MYLSFLRMVKATSLWNQLTGCFSLNQNFIVFLEDSGRRAGRPGSVRRKVFVHGIWPDNTWAHCSDWGILQPRTPWQHLTSVVLLLHMWSSWISTLNFWNKWKKKLLSTFTCIPPYHHSRSREWWLIRLIVVRFRCCQNIQFGDFTLLFCRVR